MIGDQHSAESDAPLETPVCWSHRCDRPGYIKSEMWSGYLCSAHALKGPAGRCPATTDTGIPCQKGTIRLSNGVWDHAGGHWFMSDDTTACLDADHFDPANVLALTPLVHRDVPCPRRDTPPGEMTDGTIAGHVMACHTQRGNEGWACTCPTSPGLGCAVEGCAEPGAAVRVFPHYTITLCAPHWHEALIARHGSAS